MDTLIDWLILIFGSRRWAFLLTFPEYVFPTVLSLGYAILILRHFDILEGSFDTMAGIAQFLSIYHLLPANWMH
jgi:hypothetical protein